MTGCKHCASNSLEVLAAVLVESDDISFEEDARGLPEIWRDASTDVVPEEGNP